MKRKYSLSPSHVASVLLLGSIHSWACGTNSTIVTTLPTLGGSFLQVSALNGAGQMTGFSLLPGDFTGHAFLIGNAGISDLGTLGGTFSQGFAINASGQVAGEANLSEDAETHAFLYSGGSLVDLGTLGGPFSSAVAINDAGQVAGTSMTSENLTSAFLYSDGSMLSLGTLGGSSSSATAINAAGSVTGSSSTEGDFETHAFLYTGGTMIDLGTLGGAYSVAFKLNDAGVVVGGSTLADGRFHGFVHSAGAMHDLGTLGGSFSFASAVNQAGQVIGVATTADDVETHGFLYEGGTMINLGTLGGDYSSPASLNNLGQVVGDSATADGSIHAFLWQNGEMVDLNTLLAPNSGWILISGQFINDAGRIVGYGTHNEVSQWFALDPGSANLAPVAAAGPDQIVTCQTEVTLDGNASSDPEGDALSYQWSHGGSVFSTNAVAVALFDLGTYSITLTVTDPCGESSQDELIVQVTDPIAPTLSAPPAVTIPTDANCQGAVPNLLPSVVAADNCTPASALVVVQNPAAGTLLSAGQHTLTVSVTDASGNSTAEDVTLNLVDTTAPVIVASPSILTVSAGDHCQGIVPNLVPHIVATDNCTPADGLIVTQAPPAGTLLDRGQHSVTVTVTDAAGNHTTTSVTLVIADTSAPTMVSLAASPDVLSPPNNQLISVTLTVLASDNCDHAPVSRIVSITADEPVPAGDVKITGDLTALLAASKSSSGSARIYTLTVRCTDASGNSSTGTVVVRVPKNQSGPTIGAGKPVH